MSRFSYFLLVILLVPLTAFCQSPPTNLSPAEVLDLSLKRAKEISLYTEHKNWRSVEEKVREAAKTAESIDDLAPAFTVLLNELGDYHGRVLKLPDYETIALFSDFENLSIEDDRPRDQEIWAATNDTSLRFSSALLPEKVGYLKVVGVGMHHDGQSEANRIRKELMALHAQGVEHWILDLRSNGGGNANVMFAGLAPLLDTGVVARIQGKDGEVQGTAEIRNGNFSYYGREAFQMPEDKSFASPKVAILTSRFTVSSGELLAVAFKQQANTRFFGEATGCYATNTGWEVVDDQFVLVLTTGWFCDRFGSKYYPNVPVDVEVPFDHQAAVQDDEAVQKAKNWLLSND